METKITKQNLGDHLILYQLAMVGKKLSDILDDPEWYRNNTMTQEQFEEFKAYAILLIKKVHRCSQTRAVGYFAWFNLSYGLRIFPLEK